MILDIIIRPPRNEEMKEFYEVYQSGLPGVDRIAFDSFHEWWKNGIEDKSILSFWRVAEVNNKIVGIVINSIHKILKLGIIWELSVLPNWRNKGIGSRFILESEKILSKADPSIVSFALGLKIHNHRALNLYTRAGYGIRFLVLRLTGKPWNITNLSSFTTSKMTADHVPSLLSFPCCAYWSERDEKEWLKTVKHPQSHVIYSKEHSKIVGYFRITPDEDEEDAKYIDFAFAQGFELELLNVVMSYIKNEKVVFWIQDCYQSIIEFLYKKGFKLGDCEFLMKKNID